MRTSETVEQQWAAEGPTGLPAGLTADIRALIEMMERGGIADLRLETPTVRLRLRAHRAPPSVESGGAAPVQPRAAASVPLEAPAGVVVKAPMIGTFYHTPAPGEPPFVSVGDVVEPGQTIGIIEAMKIMNEIPSDHAGVVAEILVPNGQPVEYGQPLIRLAPLPAAT